MLYVVILQQSVIHPHSFQQQQKIYIPTMRNKREQEEEEHDSELRWEKKENNKLMTHASHTICMKLYTNNNHTSANKAIITSIITSLQPKTPDGNQHRLFLDDGIFYLLPSG